MAKTARLRSKSLVQHAAQLEPRHELPDFFQFCSQPAGTALWIAVKRLNHAINKPSGSFYHNLDTSFWIPRTSPQDKEHGPTVERLE